MPARKITDAQIKQIVELRERGLGYRLIAEIVGVTESSVSWHCLRLGVEPPKPTPINLDRRRGEPVKRGGHLVRPFTEEEDALLLTLEWAGHGPSAIARRLGRRPNSVRGRQLTLARHQARAEAGL